MLDTYDMQMTDYYTDLDIQMHASSSDQWFQDEAKMEEDAPTLKLESTFLKTQAHLPMKTDPYAQEKSDATIEVDMEPISNHQNAEYDMLDDEEIHDSGVDIEDVEVYDASHGYSPAMGAVDALQGETSTFLDTFEGTETNDPLNYNLPLDPPDFSPEQVDPRELKSDDIEGVSTAQEGGSLSPAPVARFGAESKTVKPVEHLEPSLVQNSEFQDALSGESQVENFPTTDSEVSLPEPLTTELVESNADSSEALPLVDEPSQDNPDENHPLAQPTTNPVSNTDDSLGDPHEISEGVYIDPPPPVLLSLAAEEQFTFSLFNEPLEWDPPGTLTGHLLLHQLPTLYYEPLSAVFEALRHEDIIGSTCPLAEGELVLDAVDLQLSIGEDNIFAREVTLHDLNVLHDVSGISGLLRMRLYTSTPRFIVQYQQLQAQVAQLNFEQPLGEVSGDGPSKASNDESSEEKDQETIQGLPDAEDHRWEILEPLSKTAQSNDENNYGETEHNDPHAEISLKEEPASEPSEGSQKHESPSKGAKEPHVDAPEEISEENPQDQYEENYEESYEESYEENPENYHTPEQVLSALPHITQMFTNSHDASHTSEQNNHDVSPQHPPHPDLEGNVIPLEVLEADSTDGDFSEDPLSNDSHQEGTGSQLSHVVDEELNDGDNEEELEHSLATIEVPENPEIGNIAGNFEHGSYVEAEHIGGISTAEPTLHDSEDSPAIHGVLKPHSIDLEADDDRLSLESTEDPSTYGEDGWDDPDGEGEIDENWDDETENAHSNSNHSSITLSSKASKRSFDEFESNGEGYDDPEGGHWSPPSSPDPKRSRTE